MADNVAITAGSGTAIAADDISSVFYQRVKLSVGADGSATDVSSAAPLPASDNGPGWTTTWGVSGAAVTSADMSTATAVTGAPTSGQKLVITDIIVSVGSTAMQVDFEEETSGTIWLTAYLPANFWGQITPRGKFKLWTADKKLMCDTSAAGNISVTVGYYSEA